MRGVGLAGKGVGHQTALETAGEELPARQGTGKDPLRRGAHAQLVWKLPATETLL